MNGMRYALNTKDKIEKMVGNARNQGKSEEEVKLLVSVAVDQMLRKIKEDKMFL